MLTMTQLAVHICWPEAVALEMSLRIVSGALGQEVALDHPS